jgi:L-2,4-diaminobutyrate decarboxylase
MTEPSGADFEQSAARVARLLARYLDDSRAGRGPVVELRPMAALAGELKLRDWIRAGGLAAGLEAFLEPYLAHTTHMQHPGYLAHQVAVPQATAALADLVHGLTNNPMAMYEMGPAAAAVELTVVEWMLERVGWPPPRWPGDTTAEGACGSGVLTHGGSLANLTALLAARAAADPAAWDEGVSPDLVVLVPPSSHYSIGRAVSILGLGRRAIREIPVDEAEVVVPEALPALCREVRAEGKRVMAVVANACATSTGLFDPLDEIGRFCREEDLWLHVDGAHGASALLSPRARPLLNGIERADSLVWDAHKMLRTPTLCTAVLFRDERSFDHAFHEEASYLFYGENPFGVDLIHRTVECTKAGLGLKVFFALAAEGEAGLARYWDDRLEATRRFARLIRARPGFECPFEPQANVLCFRFGTDDAQQVSIRDTLLREGRYHLSSTEVRGTRYLRLAVMSPATDDSTIVGLLDAIERIARMQSILPGGSPG